MIRFDQWMLPDGEVHLQQWMNQKNQVVDGRKTYQFHKYEAALNACASRRVAVDIGAHVGLWSFWMAKDFERLVAFEPRREHIECWHENMKEFDNVTLHEVALGSAAIEVGLVTEPSSSGDTRVDTHGYGVQLRMLDSYGLTGVDFIKVDCEGFEYLALSGAIRTITRCKPVVIVEQKPGHGQRFGRGEHDAVKLLQDLGARQVWEYAGDYVMTFEKAA